MDEPALEKLFRDLSPHQRVVLEALLPQVRKMFLQLGEQPPMLAAIHYPRPPRWMNVGDLIDYKNLLEKEMIGMARRGAEFIVFISEAWFAIVNSNDAAVAKQISDFAEHHSLEDWPGRIEAVSVALLSKSREVHFSAEIIRPAGQPVELGAWNPPCIAVSAAEEQRMGGTPARFQNIWRKAGK